MTDKTDREIMQMALEALEVVTDTYDDNAVGIEIDAIIALHTRLAQPEQEPVVVIKRNESGQITMQTPDGNPFDMSKYIGAKLYTAPQKREWQGLTDEEIYECEKVGAIHYQRHKCSVRGQQLTPADDPQWHFAGAIEAKLKEKND